MRKVEIDPRIPLTDDPKDWNEFLEATGFGANLPPISPGIQVPLGDGLGGKSPYEEDLEDSGDGGGGKHSKMCPIVLGVALNGELNQPGERPVEVEVFGEYDEDKRLL